MYNNDGQLTAQIIGILEKESKYGNVYFDVKFRMAQTGNFYRSCIYTACRNFVNWKNLLQVGNVLSNLELIKKYGKDFIDADCEPVLIKQGNPDVKEDLRPIKRQVPKTSESIQQSLFDDED